MDARWIKADQDVRERARAFTRELLYPVRGRTRPHQHDRPARGKNGRSVQGVIDYRPQRHQPPQGARRPGDDDRPAVHRQRGGRLVDQRPVGPGLAAAHVPEGRQPEQIEKYLIPACRGDFQVGLLHLRADRRIRCRWRADERAAGRQPLRRQWREVLRQQFRICRASAC